MKGAALLLLFCGSLGAQQASLEGTVVNAITGQPMSGVHLRLLTGNFDSVTIYGAISNSAGRFSIASIQPGSYMLQPERTGFVFLRTGTGARPSPSLILKPGQQITDLKVEMTPRAVIAGRVLDEYGDPVPNVPVMAEAVTPSLPMAGMLGRTATDDRGEFRIRSAPGKFRVKAMPYGRSYDPQEVRTDGTSPAVYGPTYYPNTASKDHAAVVEATAGGDLTGIDIRLVRQARGLSVSGVVSGIPEGGQGVSVMLQFGESAERPTGTQGRGIQRDGKFTFPGLQPGFYRLYARSSPGKNQLQSQSVEFKLDSADMEGIYLTLAPGGELTGTVEIAGAPAEKRTIRLQPVGAMLYDAGRSAEIDKDGRFRIGNVMPDKFRVRVEPLPENAYIKTVQVDGAAAAGGMLDLSRGAHDAKLKITVASGGSLSGAVLDQDGERLVNAVVTVWLMSDANDTDPDHRARVTPEGKYSFKGIGPGKYRLAAIDPFRLAMPNGPDGSKLFETAEQIEIKEGDRMVKDVKVALKEDAHAKP